MSGVFPPFLPSEIEADPRRNGERIVFDQLSSQLGEYWVFYHCPWLDNSKGRTFVDGEIDFIVAHPHWGFIALEVKGGVISRDPDTRIWRTTNKNGQTYKIKNPVEQALKSKYVVLQKLKKAFKSRPYVRAKHGVILPESGRPKSSADLGADMPLDIFAFIEDVETLGARVIQMLMHEPADSNTQYDPLGETGIRILHDLFNKGFSLDVSLSSMLEIEDRKIEKLTREQNHFLDLTVHQKRIAVIGGAGTGKTTLAIEKIRRLSKQGLSALYLCFNRPLAAHVKRELKEERNVKVFTFHQLCVDYAKQARITLPNVEDSNDYFDVALPNCLLNALSEPRTDKFNAIVIDEGQDFREEWLDLLELALQEPDEGVFYVFSDDNQKIYKDREIFHSKIGKEPIPFSKNLRNTKPIFDAAQKFYSGGMQESAGPKGKDIEWIPYREGRQLKIVEKMINRFLNVEGIKPTDIAVLTACALDKSALGKTDGIGKIQTRPAEDIDKNQVILDSVHRFKGLDSRVVILTDVEKGLDSVELLYTAFSRARVLLVVVANEEAIGGLRQMVQN